jgi:hypothetical protein
MTGSETAISRLAFAEARHSGAEALALIAVHRREVQRATATDNKTDEQEATDLAERARLARRRLDRLA